jgi:type II secretory pathway component PulF
MAICDCCNEEAVFLIGGVVVVAAVVIFLMFLEWSRRFTKWLAVILGIFLSLAGLCYVMGPWSYLVFLFVLLFIGLAISYGVTSRYATAAYVISTIGASMRQNLPLPMALESAASGQSNKRARILRAIQKWLVQGYSLSESVQRGYPRCPGHAVAMIRAAERIDQLPQAIRAVEADMVARTDERRRIKPASWTYPVVILLILFLIFLGLMTYVIPKFREVLQELVEGELPVVTRFLMDVAGFIAYGMGPYILIMLAFTVFVVFPFWLVLRFRSRRPDKPYLVSRIGDFIKWHLPVFHWFEQNYCLVHTVELLRLSLNAGCTVNGAIANTLELDVNSCFRKRLRKWLAGVEAGDNISVAARESKLGSPLAWAFDDKVNEGNTPAILEMLESFYRSNYSYRVNLARFITEPCTTIGLGLAVGFVIYGIFSAVVAMVDETAKLMVP